MFANTFDSELPVVCVLKNHGSINVHSKLVLPPASSACVRNSVGFLVEFHFQ